MVKKIASKKPLKLSILLPVRNEAENINLMVSRLEKSLSTPHEILVIYDDPKDNTIPEIKKIKNTHKNLKTVFNKKGQGVINAIKSGIDASRGKYILILTVDDLGPTNSVEDMIILMDQGCEFVSCTRYKFGGKRLGGSLIGKIISGLANSLFILIFGTFSDATTGFKMFKRNFTSKIKLESKPVGWAVVFEMAIKAQEKGMKLGEVPTSSVDRPYGGKSTFNLIPWAKEYGKWFAYAILHFNSLNSNRKINLRIPKKNP